MVMLVGALPIAALLTIVIPVNRSLSHNNIESGKQSLYPDGDPDHRQNLIVCSLTQYQPSLKISCKSVWSFFSKVANSQTNKETNNDENITSWAEVIKHIQHLYVKIIYITFENFNSNYMCTSAWSFTLKNASLVIVVLFCVTLVNSHRFCCCCCCCGDGDVGGYGDHRNEDGGVKSLRLTFCTLH